MELLKTKELADRLSVSRETIRRWRNEGRISPELVTPGGAPRWAWPQPELPSKWKHRKDA